MELRLSAAAEALSAVKSEAEARDRSNDSALSALRTRLAQCEADLQTATQSLQSLRTQSAEREQSLQASIQALSGAKQAAEKMLADVQDSSAKANEDSERFIEELDKRQAETEQKWKTVTSLNLLLIHI